MILLALAAALAVGLWLASLAVKYRDVGLAVGFLLRVWFFLTPIVYDMEKVVPEQWRTLFRLNPMTNVVQGMRWALFGAGHGQAPDLLLGASALLVLLALVSGAYVFRRTERTIVDLI